jgi:D-3-phosphoglycerate dehydrogenase
MPTERHKILIVESRDLSPHVIATLNAFGEVRCADLDRKALLLEDEYATILWVRLRNYIDREVLDHFPRLRALVTPTTGLTHIDVNEVYGRNITLLSLQGETDFLKTIRATAEHTIGLMLAVIRRLPGAFDQVKASKWNRDEFRGEELYGKTIGIVGYGRLGKIVSKYIHAFDAKVLAADPNVNAATVDPWVLLVPLDKLLRESDIVTLHVNFHEGNRGLFGRREFAQMKEGAYFINTSRGELVDEQALLESLESCALGGAALDVLSQEHLGLGPAHPLVEYARTHDNLIITPHIGGCTKESLEKTEEFMVSRLRDWLKNGRCGS